MVGKEGADYTQTSKKPKVAEIAQISGVSPATVSKVINGRTGVSDETRSKVESVLAEYGFAKPLVQTKVSSTVELVITEVDNNGSAELIKQTTHYAQSLGIGITVSCTGHHSSERGQRKGVSTCLRGAIDRNPLGVILLLSDITAAEEEHLHARNIPYVIIDPVGQVSPETLGVGIDNWTAGLVATEYLIKLGHRKIGAITGPLNSQSSQARLSGFLAALRKVNVTPPPEYIKEGDYLPDEAFDAACQLLDLPTQDRPTAVFCFNDVSAVSLYRAANLRGIKLPEELSVVGFDNIYPSAYLYPALTSVTQPFDLIARKAIDLILAARDGRNVQNYQILPTQLQIRESCVPPQQ